jgi:hypothetical protein
MMGMIAGIIGIIFGFMLLINGFAAIRRPLSVLTQNDPIGKRILAARGENFTRIAYRVYGAMFVALGMIMTYLSINMLKG